MEFARRPLGKILGVSDYSVGRVFLKLIGDLRLQSTGILLDQHLPDVQESDPIREGRIAGHLILNDH